MRIKLLIIAGMMNMGIFYNSGFAKDLTGPMVAGFVWYNDIRWNYAEISTGKLSMDFDWKFALGHAADIDKDFDYWGGDPAGNAKTGDPAGPANPGFNDKDWQILDIPHDWVVGLNYNPSAEERHAYKEIGRRHGSK